MKDFDKNEGYSVVIATMWRSEFLLKMLPIYQKEEKVKEIILIDNEYKSRPEIKDLSKIIYYSEHKNLFVNPAWNKGVSLSKYKVIIANDDILIPNIGNVLELIDKNNYDFLGISWENSDDLKLEPVSEFLRKGYGCFMYIKNYFIIPEEFKIFRGDFFQYNNSKNPGIIFNPELDGEIAATRKSDEIFREISISDLEIYKDKYEIKIEE